jgi:hypothetical protein
MTGRRPTLGPPPAGRPDRARWRSSSQVRAGSGDEIAEQLGAAAADVDVVIDYLWGQPAQDAMMPLLMARADRSRALDWLQIGSVAGPTVALPSVALRSANFRVLGSGQGSVAAAGILAELAELANEIVRGTFAIDPIVVPLADVAEAWTAPIEPGQRVVIAPAQP